jgi:hypothetical protein
MFRWLDYNPVEKDIREMIEKLESLRTKFTLGGYMQKKGLFRYRLEKKGTHTRSRSLENASSRPICWCLD